MLMIFMFPSVLRVLNKWLPWLDSGRGVIFLCSLPDSWDFHICNDGSPMNKFRVCPAYSISCIATLKEISTVG